MFQQVFSNHLEQIKKVRSQQKNALLKGHQMKIM